MTVVLFEPHHDDAVLFACWSLLREKPLVVTVCGDATVQEPEVTQKMRRLESVAAWQVLGINEWAWQDWYISDVNPDWVMVERLMREIIEESEQPTAVYAPAIERSGNKHHSLIGQLALDVFGSRVTSYLTYTNGAVKSTHGHEVPFEPSWIGLKLRALACYESQFGTPSHRHFVDSLREYVL